MDAIFAGSVSKLQ
jgi:hypothetical protein